MRILFLLLLFFAGSSALAGSMAPPPVVPESVPLLDAWGLLALSLGVALAGAIGVIRVKKKK